jgi:hypothetical protein
MLDDLPDVLGGACTGCFATLSLLVCPVVAAVAFATGHAHTGWIALTVLGFSLLYCVGWAVERLRRD